MSLLRSLLLAAAAFFSILGPLPAAPDDIVKLHDQLALATEDEDALSRIELLRRILDADPSDTASRKLLIDLWLDVGDYDMAEAALAAWPDAPRDVAALTRAAVLRHRDGDLKGAIKVLDGYLATAPKDTTAWEALAQCLIAAKDNAALLEALDAYTALDRSPGNLIRRADAKAALGDYSGAIADARAAQALAPDAEIVKSTLPRFERLGETLQALPSLDAAIAKNPKNVAALLDRAWWLRYGGIDDRSLTDAEAALALAPASLLARLTKFRALFLLDKAKPWEVRDAERIDVNKALSLETAQAILAADLAIAKNPDDAGRLRERAYALNDAEQFLLAKRDAEHALDLDPKNADAALEGIYAASMLGADPAPLVRRIEKMGAGKGQLALAYGYLAEMYFRQSNMPLALDFADRSLAAQETARFLKVKASTLQRLNRSDEADTALHRAKTLETQAR